MVHFDFDHRYQDEQIVGRAISPGGTVLVTIVIHLLLVLLYAYGPDLNMFRPNAEEVEARRQELAKQLEKERAERRFVFVDPKLDLKALKPPPDRAPLSDLDRKAQAQQRSVKPDNQLPFNQGNSAERAEAAAAERARGPETTVKPNEEPPQPEPEERVARVMPNADTGVKRAPEVSRPAPGSLGDALRNLERYVQNQSFRNPQGGANEPGSSIQFDTKGIDFGPWVRRFQSQLYRNWFVPQAAFTFRGHVVVQFNIHKDGRITDVAVLQPSGIESFNRSAYNAILGSNPTEPLPPEYPDPVALFTVTFYYNEDPPLR